MGRSIELAVEAETLTSIAEITGNGELFRALGYLCQWNLSLGKVRVIGGIHDGVPELIASYWRDESQPVAYQLGAIWHGDHFGFHS